MATVGVVIASATVAEEVIEAGAVRQPVAAVMHAAAAGQHAPAAVARFAATQGVTIQAGRVPVQVMRQLRVAADIPAAVGMLAAAAVDMPAAVVVAMPAAAVVDMLAAAVVVVVDMPAAADTCNL